MLKESPFSTTRFVNQIRHISGCTHLPLWFNAEQCHQEIAIMQLRFNRGSHDGTLLQICGCYSSCDFSTCMLSTHVFDVALLCRQSWRSNSAYTVQVGFSEQNVRALCDVGNSTKQHKVGYIGQKGIGFKSVFKVTDVAEIHSNGFHISFDLIQHQSLGYILPTWVPVRPHAQPRVPSLQSAVTQVYLPYKQVSCCSHCCHCHTCVSQLPTCCACKIHASMAST